MNDSEPDRRGNPPRAAGCESATGGTHVGEREVAEFLQRTPDFLLRHPYLVETLEVPHDCGDAVSLLERQARRLRDRNAELHQRLESLVRNARENEELGQRVHRLTLSLIDCPGMDELLARLYQALSEDFRAEMFALRLFAAPRSAADRGLAEFDGGADPQAARAIFDGVGDDKPLYGRMRKEQAELLFAERGREAGSAALTMIGGRRRFGVLALASRDPQRYHPGMGSMFLRQLAAVLTHVVAPHLRAETHRSKSAGAAG